MQRPDPDWFYSAMAGVSATIVAIIGGFLTTFGLASGGEYRRTRRRTFALRREHVRTKAALKRSDLPAEERLALEARLIDLEPELAGMHEDALEQIYQFRLVARGLLALGLLLVTGVIVPLLLLPQDPAAWDRWQRRLVLAGFVIGLLPVLSFMWAVVDPRSYVPPRRWANQGRAQRLRRWVRRKEGWPTHFWSAPRPSSRDTTPKPEEPGAI